MEEQADYGSRLNSAKVADLIINTQGGWNEIKQGIKDAAAEIIKTESNVYIAFTILESYRTPAKSEDPA